MLSRLRSLLPLAAVGFLAVAFPFVVSPGKHFYGVLAVIYSLLALSLVVLTGWTGQISLGHAAFLGLGVYSGQRFLHAGVPFPAVLVVVGLVSAAVSLVLAVPSLRLRGVYLAIVTLAFGAACERYIFKLPFLRGELASTVGRPSFLGISTASDRNLYLVALAVLVLALWLVANLRRTDLGRVFLAVRDAEDAAMALGVNLARSKVTAFAISAALAGMAGVFYAVLFQATPAPSQFGVLQSLFLLALPVVGGLEHPAGAVVGGTLFAFAQPVTNALGVRLFLVTGLLVIFVVLSRSDGITGLARRFVNGFTDAIHGDATARYGSFVPESVGRASARNGPPQPRVRLDGALPAGARLHVRLATPTTGGAAS
ncbi:MAG: branched-chain amino acid transport system permease protein [Actinomycetota bacterium]|nr:branched-chain amino acid transport system permease protein [Actinomycetota bacterium]